MQRRRSHRLFLFPLFWNQLEGAAPACYYYHRSLLFRVGIVRERNSAPFLRCTIRVFVCELGLLLRNVLPPFVSSRLLSSRFSFLLSRSNRPDEPRLEPEIASCFFEAARLQLLSRACAAAIVRRSSHGRVSRARFHFRRLGARLASSACRHCVSARVSRLRGALVRRARAAELGSEPGRRASTTRRRPARSRELASGRVARRPQAGSCSRRGRSGRAGSQLAARQLLAAEPPLRSLVRARLPIWSQQQQARFCCCCCFRCCSRLLRQASSRAKVNRLARVTQG